MLNRVTTHDHILKSVVTLQQEGTFMVGSQRNILIIAADLNVC